MAELEHLDAVIRIFNPAIDIKAIRAKPTPPQYPNPRGEVTQVVLDSLREAREPVTSRQITLRLIAERGLDPKDRELVEIMLKRVRACLKAHRAKGLIRPALLEDGAQAWEVAG